MSRPIDEKIAVLRLDNRNFEENARQSISTFQKLDSAGLRLKNINATKSLEKLGSSAKTLNEKQLIGIAASLQKISGRFTTMGIAGMAAISNITNRIINFGMKVARGLFITPITDGLREYETKINSIQTIMSNTQGKNTMKEITGILNELNAYADKTIYNFAEMTRNIGTFTAAGVGLKDSAVAIKGIANLAAASGSNAQQASTAMYQLSQALASGSVKLMDWNSVVNAGMGGKLFQDALKKTANEMGINVDKSLSFRDSLQKGWLTSEVLLKTLAKFAEDDSMLAAATKVKTFTQLIDTAKEALGSGWAMTWEIIIGDFEQARERFTQISNALSKIFDRDADRRNLWFSQLADAGFGEKVMEIVLNTIKMLDSWKQEIQSILSKILPSISPGQIISVLEKINNIIKKLTIQHAADAKRIGRVIVEEGQRTTPWLVKIKKVIFGIATVVKIALGLLKDFGSFIAKIIPKDFIRQLLSDILDYSVVVSEFLMNLERTKKVPQIMGKIGSTSIMVYRKIRDAAIYAFKSIRSIVKESPVIAFALETLKKLYYFIKERLEAIDWKKAFGVAGIVGLFKFIMELIKIIKAALEPFFTFLQNLALIPKGVNSVLDSIAGVFDSISKKIRSKIIINYAIAIAIMAGAFWALSRIPVEDALNAAASMAIIVIILKSFVNDLDKINKVVFGSGIGSSVTLVSLGIALVLFARAVKKMTQLDPEKALKGVGLVGILLMELSSSLRFMTGGNGVLVIKASGSIIAMALAIRLLVKAVSKFGEMNTDVIKQGMIAVLGILVGFSIFARGFRNVKLNMAAVLIMLEIGFTILILSKIAERVGKIDTKVILKGLLTISALLIGLSLFLKSIPTQNPKAFLYGALGVYGLTMAIIKLMGPIKELAALSLLDIIKSTAALSIILLVMGKATKDAEKAKNGGLALSLLTLTLVALIKGLQSFAKVGWTGILASTLGLSVIILTLAHALEKVTGLERNVVILVVAFAGLCVLAPALEKIAKLPVKGVIVAVLAIAAISATVVIAGRLAGKALFGILALAVAFAAIRLLSPVLADISNINSKTVLISVLAIIAIAAAIAVASTIIDKAVFGALALSAAIWSLQGLVPVFQSIAGIKRDEVISLIIGIAGVLGVLTLASMALTASGIPGLIALSIAIPILGLAVMSIGTGIKAFADALVVLAGVSDAEVKRIADNVGAFVVALEPHLPRIMETGAKMIISFLAGIAGHIAEIVNVGIKIVAQLLSGIASNIGEIINVATTLIVAFMLGLANNLPRLVSAGISLMFSFIVALAQGIRDNVYLILGAIGSVIEAILEVIVLGLLSVIKTILGWIPGVNKAMDNAGKSLTTTLRKSFDVEGVMKEKNRLMQKGMQDNKIPMQEKAKEVSNATVAGLESADTYLAGSGEINDFIKGFMSKDMGALGSGEINEFMKGFMSKDMGALGSEQIDELVDGMVKRGELTKKAGEDMKKQLKAGINKGGSLEKEGSNLGGSFAKGVRSMYISAYEAGAYVASGAQKGVRKALMIHSPSRIGLQLGGNFGLALADGIATKAKTVSQKASAIAKRAVQAVAIQMERYRTNLDITPRITPILDDSRLKLPPRDAIRLPIERDVQLSADRFGNIGGRLQGASSSEQINQNTYNTTINNERMLDGATFVVREEADISKIGRALAKEQHLRLQKKGLSVMPI